MTRSRLFVLVALFALWPAAADAEIGWWDWLEQLSGPGPFNNGVAFEFRLGCVVRTPAPDGTEGTHWVLPWGKNGPDHKYPCLFDDSKLKPEKMRGYFQVRGGHVTSDNKPLFPDAPNELKGTVSANAVEGFLMRQVDTALSVGAGAGLIWFSGDNVEGRVGRLLFTPISVAFTPFKIMFPASRKAGFVTIYVEETAILGGLKAADFNKNSKSSYRSSTELTRSVSVIFDLFALKWW